MFHKPQIVCLSFLKCVYNLVKKEMSVTNTVLPVNVIAFVTLFLMLSALRKFFSFVFTLPLFDIYLPFPYEQREGKIQESLACLLEV